MLHLLNIEILKLQRNRSFLVLISLFVLSVFGVNYLAMELATNNKFGFSFPSVWRDITYISSFLLVIPGLIIIMHTCSEYSYRTHRQNIIDGLSRNQYITTKILFVVALALLSTILTFISAFVIGLSSDTTISFVDFRYIYYFFIQSLMYISLAFLFALLLKKSALSIGIFFIYSLIIENILERYLSKINAGDLLPLSSSDHLLSLQVISTFIPKDSKPEFVYVIVSIIYIILCYAICYYRYEKQDL
ncbi:MAG: ABC transporter permease subunit [Prevotellaceae bacterium]|nr:ABC transporter permease subunit [Prevotellaceae bacterium]